MTHRILSVEQSASMRSVIEKHAQSLGYEVQSCDNYQHAGELLYEQFQAFDEQFSGVIFGWPTTDQDDAAEFAKQLESNDHKDLPVIVMSPDLRAETRAWVAARHSTVLLPWKKYKALDRSLKKLISVNDGVNDSLPEGGELLPSSDVDVNHDIHVLLVDDSTSIRYALRDLFLARGYQISMAASMSEAVELAASTAIDIVISDYYLSDATGDVLCSKLSADERVGELVCAVLASDHSDPVIKRCLRAGAIECINKNEPSELLLSRIDAISRLLRKNRNKVAQPLLLDQIVEHTAGPVIVIDEDDTIKYVNTLALQQLGVANSSSLIGKDYKILLVDELPGKSESQVNAATWNLPDGTTARVDYQHSLLGDKGHRLLSFARLRELVSQPTISEQLTPVRLDTLIDTAIHEFSLPVNCRLFLRQMLRYLRNERKRAEVESTADTRQNEPGVSLLVLDVFLQSEDSMLEPLSEVDYFATRVKSALLGMLNKQNHVVAFSENRFAFLLRHSEETQSYVLTRRVMQRCLELQKENENNSTIVCSGSLLSLSKNSAQTLNSLLHDTFLGLDLVIQKGVNQAILLDVRRLLSAYPVKENTE